MFKKVVGLLMLMFLFLWPSIGSSRMVGEISTGFKFVGKGNRIVIEAFNDPKIKGVTCHICRAKQGEF